MLKDRLRTSTVLIAIVTCLLYLDGQHSIVEAEGLWLLPVLLFFAAGTAHDAASMLGKSGRPVHLRAAVFGTLLITGMGYVPHLWSLTGSSYPVDCPVGRMGWLVLGSAFSVFILLGVEMSKYGTDSEKADNDANSESSHPTQPPSSSGAIERVCNGSFIVIYAGLPLALLVAMRGLGTGNWGLAALLTTIAVTKSTDSGAYFTGKAIGKHKLIPRLSPGKTWEGSIGGVLTAIVVAYACLRWLFPAIAGDSLPPSAAPSIPLLSTPLIGAIVLGGLLAVSGMLGDLAESLVKRECGAKDSGHLLPGLGGVWDVTDSLIVAAIPAYLCFSAGVAG